jgi:hypothetical protein
VKHSIEMTRLINEALAAGAPAPAEAAPQEPADGAAEEDRDEP